VKLLRKLVLFSSVTLLFSASILLFSGVIALDDARLPGRVMHKEGGLLSGRVYLETSSFGVETVTFAQWEWCPTLGLNAWCVEAKNDFLAFAGVVQLTPVKLILTDVLAEIAFAVDNSPLPNVKGELYVNLLEYNFNENLPSAAEVNGLLDEFSFQSARLAPVRLNLSTMSSGDSVGRLESEYLRGELNFDRLGEVEYSLRYISEFPVDSYLLRLLGLSKVGEQIQGKEFFDIKRLLEEGLSR